MFSPSTFSKEKPDGELHIGDKSICLYRAVQHKENI